MYGPGGILLKPSSFNFEMFSKARPGQKWKQLSWIFDILVLYMEASILFQMWNPNRGSYNMKPFWSQRLHRNKFYGRIMVISKIWLYSRLIKGKQTITMRTSYNTVITNCETDYRRTLYNPNVCTIKQHVGLPDGWIYSISQEICTRFLLCCALLWL